LLLKSKPTIIHPIPDANLDTNSNRLKAKKSISTGSLHNRLPLQLRIELQNKSKFSESTANVQTTFNESSNNCDSEFSCNASNLRRHSIAITTMPTICTTSRASESATTSNEKKEKKKRRRTLQLSKNYFPFKPPTQVHTISSPFNLRHELGAEVIDERVFLQPSTINLANSTAAEEKMSIGQRNFTFLVRKGKKGYPEKFRVVASSMEQLVGIIRHKFCTDNETILYFDKEFKEYIMLPHNIAEMPDVCKLMIVS
jgi:hypothetical protein